MQTGVIVMILFLPALTFILYMPLPMISATGVGMSEDIPAGVNDPTLPQSSTPNMSNTTSEDIPAGVNDPNLLLPSS
ncbi:MAG: hypothetical protein GEU26_17570 [Nitrososphaeraceae archaeon]|nr:hypothetical protein [Nitrososphaeraceae archaeon]